MSKNLSILRQRNWKTEFSLWKRIKCFPSTLRQRKFKNATITANHRCKEITWLSWLHRKALFLKRFSSTRKRKASNFNFLRFKDPFSWRISVDGIGLAVEIKLRFQIPPANCGRGLIVLCYHLIVVRQTNYGVPLSIPISACYYQHWQWN